VNIFDGRSRGKGNRHGQRRFDPFRIHLTNVRFGLRRLFNRKNPRRENAGNKETRKSPVMTAKEKQAAKTKKTGCAVGVGPP
jgi:hypothetical protein